MLSHAHFNRKITFNHLPKILMFLGFFLALNALFIIQNEVIQHRWFGVINNNFWALLVSFTCFLAFCAIGTFVAKIWKKYHAIYLTDKTSLHDVVFLWTKEIHRFRALLTLFFLFIIASIGKFAQIEVVYYRSCVNNLLLWNKDLQLTWMVLFGIVLTIAFLFTSFCFYSTNQQLAFVSVMQLEENCHWVEKTTTKWWNKFTNCYLTVVCKWSKVLKSYWRKFFDAIIFSLSNFRRHYFVTIISGSSYFCLFSF